jgi:hypothetical protein
VKIVFVVVLVLVREEKRSATTRSRTATYFILLMPRGQHLCHQQQPQAAFAL